MGNKIIQRTVCDRDITGSYYLCFYISDFINRFIKTVSLMFDKILGMPLRYLPPCELSPPKIGCFQCFPSFKTRSQRSCGIFCYEETNIFE